MTNVPYTYLGAVIISPSCKKVIYRNSPVVSSVIRIWKQIRTHFRVETLPLLIPIADNPFFIPSTLDKGFQQWRIFKKIQEKYKLQIQK